MGYFLKTHTPGAPQGDLKTCDNLAGRFICLENNDTTADAALVITTPAGGSLRFPAPIAKDQIVAVHFDPDSEAFFYEVSSPEGMPVYIIFTAGALFTTTDYHEAAKVTLAAFSG